MPDRGKVYNRALATQARDYSGLNWGKITPTDIDLFIDFGDRQYIFGELKTQGAEMPYGQQLALERLCNACNKAGKKAFVVVATHNTPLDEDIDAENAVIERYFHEGKWRLPKQKTTLRKGIEILKSLGKDST